MKKTVKRELMKAAANAALAVGKTTAMSISRLGAFEPEVDDEANRVLRNWQKKG